VGVVSNVQQLTLQVISIITDTFIKPIVDVLSRCLSNIHVTHAKGTPRDPSAHNLHMA
jgi:hypothetical protein